MYGRKELGKGHTSWTGEYVEKTIDRCDISRLRLTKRIGLEDTKQDVGQIRVDGQFETKRSCERYGQNSN